MTPLIHAPGKNNIELMQRLIMRPGMINQPDLTGNISLHYAAQTRFLNGIFLLG